jgi:hypothetical protein
VAVLRKVLGLAAVTVAAGLAVAGCAPIKMGSAAIVGNDSVSVAQLTTDAGSLASGAQTYPLPSGGLTQQEITQATLSWLIRFQIADQLASQNGITVTQAQAQTALDEFYSSAAQQLQQDSVNNASHNQILVAYGIPLNQTSQLGRWLAVENAYEASANGGKAPTTQAQATQAQAKYTRATCETAKSLNIQVNPQFGRMDYSQYAVVTVADTVSRPSGKVQTSSQSGLSPAC